VSDVLTRLDDFHSAPALPPSMRSMQIRPQREFAVQLRGTPTAAERGFINEAPSPTSTPVTSGAVQPDRPPASPAALTKKPSLGRLEAFVSALKDAIELADNMVAEDEGGPLDAQTFAYAVQALAPLIATTDVPPALILPLQNGGISAEWHTAGLNIELRFRKPYEVYAVLEDARGAIVAHHGRDPHLVQTRAALRELGKRSLG
jgi:hypothetical protein